MKATRKLSRRSFMVTVVGVAGTAGSALVIGGSAEAKTQVTDTDRSDPLRPGHRVRTGCSDSDRGQGSDPAGWGRRCRPATGHTDNDPGDPVNGGRGPLPDAPRTGITDSDPTDPVGNAPAGHRERGSTGCSDSDPTDRAASGRNCRPSSSGGRDSDDAHQTGRRERRYEVCWVDHPDRSNDECNMQTYSEWQITSSDGRVEHDTAESARRRAEMEARGYTARWHRMLVNEW